MAEYPYMPEPDPRDTQAPERSNEPGGLFSEDYEAPKRENPYLRKNREKARPPREPKPPKPPKPNRDKPSDRSSEPMAVPAAKTSGSAGELACRHKRTLSDFFFEHVKLITAIITVVAVLSLVLIVDIIGWAQNRAEEKEQAERPLITMTYLEGLTQKPEAITWSDLSRFRRTDTDAKDSVTWYLEVKGTNFQIMISGISTDKKPTFVYLYDMNTGDRMDLNRDDLQAFLRTHPTS